MKKKFLNDSKVKEKLLAGAIVKKKFLNDSKVKEKLFAGAIVKRKFLNDSKVKEKFFAGAWVKKQGDFREAERDIMDIKINQTQPVNQVEHTQNTAAADGSFKFTLVSAIEESALAEKLNGMLEEITGQGEKIKKRRDISDMRKYRSLIKDFMNEIVNRSHKFSRENFLDKRGRHRVYGMIRLVDEKLDLIAEELIKDEQDSMLILNSIDEIRGLLLDILT